MSQTTIIEDIFSVLPTVINYHKPGSKLYFLLKKIARSEIESLFSSQDELEKRFDPFGSLSFPYFKMGSVDSLNLFDIDELIIFSFYLMNKSRYKKFLDIGANIGLHSIIAEKCGFEVQSFEPDPIHFDRMKMNIKLNRCTHIQPFNAAVSNKSGEAEFIRVLGNTTGSHLSGSKKNPYGDLKKITVKIENINELITWADLMKIDAEGHEKEILLSTTRNQWLKTDAIVEVENKDNAQAIYNHFTDMGINLFPQKNNWAKAVASNEMPTSYRDGSLFITSQDHMPWISL